MTVEVKSRFKVTPRRFKAHGSSSGCFATAGAFVCTRLSILDTCSEFDRVVLRTLRKFQARPRLACPVLQIRTIFLRFTPLRTETTVGLVEFRFENSGELFGENIPRSVNR